MYKYVCVYILVFMYNSFSMCYFGNIVEINKKLNSKKLKIIFLQWNGCKFSIHVLIWFNLIQLHYNR